MLVLEGLVGLHSTVKLQLLQHYWLGHRLGLLWYWMVCLETNTDHSVISEIASKSCISDPFVDYDGYSISSKGFLLTVVDIMVIWVKFIHSVLVHWFWKGWCSLMLSSVWPLPTWMGLGKFNSDDHYIYYCEQKLHRRNGIALIVNKRIWNEVLGCNLKNDRMISVHFQGIHSTSQ